VTVTLDEDTTYEPGTLDFNGDGLAGCTRCGWRGVPAYVNGERSNLCPKCEGAPSAERQVKKVGRNDPCPCGSGKKAKKCCHR
jgi:hypothetical protein